VALPVFAKSFHSIAQTLGTGTDALSLRHKAIGRRLIVFRPPVRPCGQVICHQGNIPGTGYSIPDFRKIGTVRAFGVE